MSIAKRSPWFCQDCRIEMKYVEHDDFYKCPKCGAELWPADTCKPSGEIEIMMQEFARSHKLNECLPAGEAKLGGGSKSKVGKNEKMKKKTLSQINQGLNGKCSSFDN